MNTFDQKPNFNYYHNHQFHKLVNKLPENKTFSLLHTNICYTQTFVKEGINFTPRKDLAIIYSDEDNEFQCSWIELLNEKKT